MASEFYNDVSTVASAAGLMSDPTYSQNGTTYSAENTSTYDNDTDQDIFSGE